MKWLLIAIFCSTASAALLGSNRCTWGPAYWCKGVETAKKCNAVSHCVRMWKAQPGSTVSNTETCLVCKIVIEGLKTLVANKKTQKEIKELAEEMCDLMKKEKTAYEVCNTVVYVYLPEVLKMIDSEIDTDTICKLLRLCDSSKLVNKLNRLTDVLQKAKSVKDYEHCSECELAVVMFKDYLSNKKIQKELMVLMKRSFCSRLPEDLKAACNTFATHEMPNLFHELEKILDPKSVCTYFYFCPETLHKTVDRDLVGKLIKKQFRASGVECQLCQTGISDARDILRSATFQKEFETFLKTEVCTHLGSLTKSCQTDVTKYLPVVIKFAINELNPLLTCKTLGLCSKSRRLTMMDLSPAKMTRVSHLPSLRSFPLCAICEFVMNKVESMIGINRTEAAITAALEEVCSIMPQTVRAECDNFVDKYASQVIKLLMEKVAPTLICTSLGLCFGETAEKNTELRFQKLNHGDLL